MKYLICLALLLHTGCVHGPGGAANRSAGNIAGEYTAGRDVVVNIYGNNADQAADKALEGSLAASANVAGTAGKQGDPAAVQPVKTSGPTNNAPAGTQTDTAPAAPAAPAAPETPETPVP